jgi:septum formation protein
MTILTGQTRLILASKSAGRAHVLKAAGLVFDQIVSGVDEDAIKDALRAEGASVGDQADALAETKAVRVSAKHGGIVLGADQMLEIDGQALDKAASLEEVREQLQRLRGKTHVLHTALVACIEGAPVWRHLARPRLTMRNFSDAFLEAYIAQLGDDLLTTVGCYKIEGMGAHLFSRIEGDQYSIMGMPLLPLLGWLRDRGDVLA